MWRNSWKSSVPLASASACRKYELMSTAVKRRDCRRDPADAERAFISEVNSSMSSTPSPLASCDLKSAWACSISSSVNVGPSSPAASSPPPAAAAAAAAALLPAAPVAGGGVSSAADDLAVPRLRFLSRLY